MESEANTQDETKNGNTNHEKYAWEGGRVQGWESTCWGGFPYSKSKKVFWFLVSWFQKCVMLSKDILYILPNAHFMIFDRYKIHIKLIEIYFCKMYHFPILIFTNLNKKDSRILNRTASRNFRKIKQKTILRFSDMKIIFT